MAVNPALPVLYIPRYVDALGLSAVVAHHMVQNKTAVVLCIQHITYQVH